jgi:hypothetical protein
MQKKLEAPTTTTTTPSAPTRLIPVVDWPKHHPYPSIGGIRHLAHHREANGASEWIVMIGRRMLIDEAAFFAWARRGVSTPVAVSKASKRAARRKGGA